MKTIYLAGGCFWCTEAVFQQLQGVLEVTPGYMGGIVPQPSYEQVSSGHTGHTETIKVLYDESVLPFSDLLDVFFEIHDPTSLNSQGADHGTQYRSAIFYTEEGQREQIMNAIKRIEEYLPNEKRVVTEVMSATEFYPAEEYHYSYYLRNKNAPYCQVVISPKLEKLQKQFSDKLRS